MLKNKSRETSLKEYIQYPKKAFPALLKQGGKIRPQYATKQITPDLEGFTFTAFSQRFLRMFNLQRNYYT
jgi:hypothetical protein